MEEVARPGWTAETDGMVSPLASQLSASAAEHHVIYKTKDVIQGCITIFNDSQSLKMKAGGNRNFRLPCSEKSRMDLFKVFQISAGSS